MKLFRCVSVFRTSWNLFILNNNLSVHRRENIKIQFLNGGKKKVFWDGWFLVFFWSVGVTRYKHCFCCSDWRSSQLETRSSHTQTHKRLTFWTKQFFSWVHQWINTSVQTVKTLLNTTEDFMNVTFQRYWQSKPPRRTSMIFNSFYIMVSLIYLSFSAHSVITTTLPVVQSIWISVLGHELRTKGDDRTHELLRTRFWSIFYVRCDLKTPCRWK